MFLDEKLLEIGRNAELTEEGTIAAIREMVRVCIYHVISEIKDNDGALTAYRVAFKRVFYVWDSVAETLKKEGRNFIKVGAFKEEIMNDDKFKIIWN